MIRPDYCSGESCITSEIPGKWGARDNGIVYHQGQSWGDSSFNDSDSGRPFRFRLRFPSSCYNSDSDSNTISMNDFDSDSDSNTIFMNDSDSDSDSSTAYILILTSYLYKFSFKYTSPDICIYKIILLYAQYKKTWFSLCTFVLKNVFKSIPLILAGVSITLII